MPPLNIETTAHGCVGMAHSRACPFIFYEMGNTSARYHVRIFERICYQKHRYLFWLSRQGVYG
jgi:hypothetical protein